MQEKASPFKKKKRHFLLEVNPLEDCEPSRLFVESPSCFRCLKVHFLSLDKSVPEMILLLCWGPCLGQIMPWQFFVVCLTQQLGWHILAVLPKRKDNLGSAVERRGFVLCLVTVISRT